MSIYKGDHLATVMASVESITQQTVKDIDLFIQFDGVIDVAVENYISSIESSHVICFKREINKGLAYSLNELLHRVLHLNYEYIARMDADDICMPNRLERQLTYLKEHPEVDCVGTWAIEINNNGEEYYKKQMPESHDACKMMFRKRDCMIHPSVMFRRSYFKKAGYYPLDTYFGEDTMMWAQGFKAGCIFANVPEYLLKFRIDDKFFERRRGWEHAKSIFLLRRRVNKMLNFGFVEDVWALVYAGVKMMPKPILNFLYKVAR